MPYPLPRIPAQKSIDTRVSELELAIKQLQEFLGLKEKPPAVTPRASDSSFQRDGWDVVGPQYAEKLDYNR